LILMMKKVLAGGDPCVLPPAELPTCMHEGPGIVLGSLALIHLKGFQTIIPLFPLLCLTLRRCYFQTPCVSKEFWPCDTRERDGGWPHKLWYVVLQYSRLKINNSSNFDITTFCNVCFNYLSFLVLLVCLTHLWSGIVSAMVGILCSHWYEVCKPIDGLHMD
jgi:hypothetical protein